MAQMTCLHCLGFRLVFFSIICFYYMLTNVVLNVTILFPLCQPSLSFPSIYIILLFLICFRSMPLHASSSWHRSITYMLSTLCTLSPFHAYHLMLDILIPCTSFIIYTPFTICTPCLFHAYSSLFTYTKPMPSMPQPQLLLVYKQL